MKSGIVVLHLGESWLSFDGQKLTALSPYPRLDEPVRVLDDFPGSVFGVMSVEGASGQVAALIERKVRDQGLVDGESHMLIHRKSAIAGAVQALYTAIPVESWQRTLSWADSQPDHCMVMSLAALLEHHISSGTGIIFQYGRQFVLLAQQGKMLVHGAIQSYSNKMDDLKSAITMLGEQILARRADGAPLKLIFCSLLLAASTEEESALIAAFTRVTQIEVTPAPSVNILDHKGVNCRSALPYLLKPWSTRDAANPLATKCLAWAEDMLPICMAASVVVALGLFVYGGYLFRQADAQSGRAKEIAQSSAHKELAVSKLKTDITLPASYKAAQGFYNRLTRVEGEYNPYKVLIDVRNAAGKDLRIMRVRYDSSDKTSLILDCAERQPSFDTKALADFMSRLRGAGYDVTPIDPSDPSQTAQHFSYRLAKKNGLQQ